ncbi:MAG: hypothetical protein U5L45_25865 [Saprospiraceae bacterium]|nr:hypothetical protein [Saprospiraceae bacterium]
MRKVLPSFYTYRNHLAHARFARGKEGEVVHFSGKARKMNHIPLFCERGEQ